MVILKETNITLKSGKEIKLKPLTFDNRNELKDLAAKYYSESGNIASYYLFGKAVRFGTDLKEDELIGLSDLEILEIGGKVFESLNLTDTDKKIVIACFATVFEKGDHDKSYPLNTQLGNFENEAELNQWFLNWNPKSVYELFWDFSLVGKWSFIFTDEINSLLNRHRMLKEYGVKSFGDNFDQMPALWIDIVNIIDANYGIAIKEKGRPMAKTKQLDIKVTQTGATKATGEVNKLGKSVSGTMNNFSKFSGILTGVFAGAIVSSTVDMAKAGAAAKDITRAFQRLNDPTLLNNLRTATRGTVTDLELMTAAVKADKFQIPLKDMGKYLQFAQMTAKDTGQSVDYMVDSIVTGVARKSIPILDNLGLSSIRINEEFSKTGDFIGAIGNIIDEELAGADLGDLTDAEKIQRATVEWDNLANTFKTKLSPYLASFMSSMSRGARYLFGEKTIADLEQEIELETRRLESVKKTLADGLTGAAGPERFQKTAEHIKENIENLKLQIAGMVKAEDDLNNVFTNSNYLLTETGLAYKRAQEELVAYNERRDSFRSKYLADNKAKEEEAKWLGEINEEIARQNSLLREQAGMFSDTSIMSQLSSDAWNQMSPQSGGLKELEEINLDKPFRKAQPAIDNYIAGIKLASDYSTQYANQFSATLGSAIVQQWYEGQNAMSAFFEAFKATLAAMVAELMARAAIFSLFSALGKGSLLGGAGFILKGFATGGSFTVGGSGGTDTQPVAFMATPGERVTVETPEQQMNGNAININFNGAITDRRYVNDYIIPEIKRAVRLGRA